MNRETLIHKIKEKQSFLCVGLDTDITKIPKHLLEMEDPIFEFNKQIIDATQDLCVAYKPNLAFYESLGVDGWKSLERTINYISDDIFTIADAKRGDIGNTSKLYARAFFERMSFDSITVAPYMGKDSVTPFLEYPNKWVILLALTSNEGALDFQFLPLELSKNRVFEKVIKRSQDWGTESNLMYVVGATRGKTIQQVREAAPNHFFLVPGIGAQGGSLEEVAKYGMTDECGLLVNSSRSIIYASNGLDFAEKAREKALAIQLEMRNLLSDKGII